MNFLCPLVWICVFSTCSGQFSYDFETVPMLTPFHELYILDVYASLHKSVNVTCKVMPADLSESAYVRTYWELANTKEILYFDSISGVATNYSFITVSGSLNETLKIANFTADLDRLKLGCKGNVTSNERVVITFGIPVEPTIIQTPPVYNATESETFEMCFQAPENNPFPPIVTPLWFLDEELIISGANGIQIGDYNITIESVDRTYSGRKFEFRITNDVKPPPGFKNFTLNVQYPPEATLATVSSVYASVGDMNTTLTALWNLSGNPFPSSWWDVGDKRINLDDQFSSKFPGQLIITNILKEDFGQYTFTASNGIRQDLNMTISLLEIEPRFNSVNLTSVNGGLNITWVLLHTGFEKDTTKVSVSVECQREKDYQNDNETVYYCDENCVDKNLMGSGFIEGPLYAGRSYECILNVTTVNGSNTFEITGFKQTSGIPSFPRLSVEADPGRINISILSQYTGVPSDDDSYQFTIVVTDKDNVVVYNNTNVTRFSQEYIIIYLTIGNYTVKISSKNRYGRSEETILMAEVSMDPPTPPVTEEPSPTVSLVTEEPSPTVSLVTEEPTGIQTIIAIVVGTGISLLVIVVIIIIIILSVLLFCNRRSREQNKQEMPQMELN